MNEATIRVYGTPWCMYCKRARKFLGEHRIQFQFIDVDVDAEGLRVVEQANHGEAVIPTIFFPDGSMLVRPTNTELAEKLGVQDCAECMYYDLVIVGAGPAGLTAAFYAAREGIETLVVEKGAPGGHPGTIGRVENYPGFPEGIAGAELAERLVQQVLHFQAEILSGYEAVGLMLEGDDRTIQLSDGREARAPAVLLAPGSTYSQLDVPGEKELLGSGVHYCATCDGPLYRGKNVLVVGGGNAAVQEGLFLTRFAHKVTIATRDPELTATRIIQDTARRNPLVEIVYNTTIEAFRGNGRLSSVLLRDTRTGERREAQPDGVFVFIGITPNTRWLKEFLKLDERGFIVTEPAFQTSLTGVFAAGDARAGSTKQVVSAAADGAGATMMIRQYLERMRVLAEHPQ